ncbi:MAG: geranylgeranylglyceryl/heptaprenylglyceryl phosphate synthase [Ignisphaera sp.]|jgi:phosphoglycerol geranylgeranyltransferase|nr:geranylgeranylglyceryl/heptaprenylglyceryl phosphate synthase [Ignisphaera sp.]MCC6057126.1 geranylgeranylglyceryl/heptaprenylglyceryl phosphate synthase [Desulfurococcaceae archaeon]
MKYRGMVYRLIEKELSSDSKLHFTLIDPEKVTNLEWLSKVLKKVVDAGTDAILIGGSLQVFIDDVERIVALIEEFDKPSILFPGNLTGLARNADAILFISLLNSDNPYYIIGAHVIAAPLIKRIGLEVLPTGYIVVGNWDTSVSIIGRARPIPYDKPGIGVAYALAAKFLGMKFVYLEAGSGALQPVPQTFVKAVKKAVEDTILIVGGGIRSSEKAAEIANAGADIIVTGTIVEEKLDEAVKIIEAVKRK